MPQFPGSARAGNSQAGSRRVYSCWLHTVNKTVAACVRLTGAGAHWGIGLCSQGHAARVRQARARPESSAGMAAVRCKYTVSFPIKVELFNSSPREFTLYLSEAAVAIRKLAPEFGQGCPLEFPRSIDILARRRTVE